MIVLFFFFIKNINKKQILTIHFIGIFTDNLYIFFLIKKLVLRFLSIF